MNEDTAQDGQSLDPIPGPGGISQRKRIWLNRGGMLVGFLLLGAAILVIWQQWETISVDLEAVLHPAPLDVAILLGCVAINIMLSGVVFNILLGRYWEGGFLGMEAVIGTGALWN